MFIVGECYKNVYEVIENVVDSQTSESVSLRAQPMANIMYKYIM